ncbi:peptidyl-prolyl cis-trans isomerase FKBP13, chloroplastic isoform X1 [Rhododendron vialii]|uniref:peptidyl-prolyl cis-trans isomerase FKBP13, chloroplastic isoform X1 n=1 Tax=Rhododendron vialii TaxID=182163 RepID=UPI00265DF29A|nr:peptidyl-prolyl cis-trans isomerase FKBP13, chloroplastic isoform X1 [Rhododendron vialii]
MSTLPFSLGSCNPRKLIVIRNLHTSEESPTSSIKFSSHIIHNETTFCSAVLLKLNQKNPIVLVKRREAISAGLCSGILGVILQQSKVSAAEASSSSTTTPSPCELTQAPSGLAYCDKVVGYGPEAVKGQLIKAHYVGKLENGKVFDSSYNRGKPLTFHVGVGEVIKGWDQGILGGDGVPPMLAGGKRSLKLPPELGYGIRGVGCRGGSCIIPPDSVLLFDVEFIGKG